MRRQARISCGQKRLAAAAFMSLCFLVPPPGQADKPLGTDPRLVVMTATDPGAQRIASRPRPTTIATLSAMPRPAALPLDGKPAPQYRHVRFAPVETTLWAVDADLIEIHHADDGDYHLLLKDPQGRRLVCELPDPAKLQRPCRFAGAMVRARARLALLKPSKTVMLVNTHVQIIGVGYFGAANPLESSARNGIQLHPVVSIMF